jgi:putative ABC transport system ATP-binding protein
MTAVAPLPLPTSSGRSAKELVKPLVELSHVSKEYDTGGGIVRAMRDVSLSISQGEFVAIIGASGSGKSTLMNILGCLDRPTRGTYTLAAIEVGDRKGDSRAIVRNRVIGFVFQGFNLLARTTALENVELPLQYRGVGVRERRRRAKAALEAVGLGDRLDHSASQLSGGQQQRVAIARALVTDPPLLLADEPTGNLDTRTSLEVLALLQRLNRERGITVVLVTHERDIAACASRVVSMRDGRIVSDVAQDQPMDAAAELARLPAVEDAEGESKSQRPPPDVESVGERVGGPVPLSVYAMMWLGDLLGDAAGASYVGLVLQRSVVRDALWWLAIGELTKAWIGASWARRRLGRPPTNDQRVRMALWYSLPVTGVALLSLSLALARAESAAGLAREGWASLALGSRHPSQFAVAAVGVVGCCVLLRYLLLTLFSPRR